jgi:hypothetical protein
MLKMRTALITACGILMITAMATVAYGALLDPYVDFPQTQGQNGYRAEAYNPLTPAFRDLEYYNPYVFVTTGQGAFLIPQVVKNTSGVVKLHPMIDGSKWGTEWAVLQYIAPSAGKYKFNVQFYNANGTAQPCSTEALVFLDLNSATPYMPAQAVDGTHSPIFAGTVQLTQGQKLNFAVRSAIGWENDSTGLRTLNPVPEPSSLMIFGSGILSVLAAGLRRRKASR